MCGIIGAVALGDFGLPPEIRIEPAMQRLASRGPDASAVFAENGVTLGHLRLAIIDVSSAANQPMTSACGRYTIVFNGEIYNYRELRDSLRPDGGWRTESDTETILQAFAQWGASCLDKFHGMFAIAIWDRRDRSLFLARDRLGVKPLYYRTGPGYLAFASRPGALRALMPSLPWKMDRQALRWFVEAGYVPAPNSFFEGLHKLPPGHYATVDAKGVNAVRYWTLDAVAENPALRSKSEAELLDELEHLVDRSIRWRMVSSVPVGAFLSGGIDSSLVVSRMVKQSTEQVRTFTIGFSDKDFDESDAAQAIARHLGTAHTVQQLSPKGLLDLLPRFLSEFDEPFYDYSAIPVMAVSRLAREQVKVVLSGDGGDEAFGGYHYYRAMALMQRAYLLPPIARQCMAAVLRRMNGRAQLMGQALERPTPVAAFAFARSIIKGHGDIMAPSLRAETRSLQDLFESRAANLPLGLSAVETAMRLDIGLTLPDDYLQKLDVSSMAFSVEAREPLLEHSILEWAAGLQSHWKLRGGENKYLLRRLAYRHVPKELLDRPKKGFGMPINAWLRGELHGWAREILNDTENMRTLELDHGAIQKLWNAHQAKQVDAGSTLWGVLMLIAFLRTHVNGAGA